MVQRELGERLFAAPRTKAYSAVSVLVQLACRARAARAVPRTVFRPRPRVDSAFVRSCGAGCRTAAGSRRRAADRGEYEAVDRLVRAAFGQRRKLLVNSLPARRTRVAR